MTAFGRKQSLAGGCYRPEAHRYLCIAFGWPTGHRTLMAPQRYRQLPAFLKPAAIASDSNSNEA